MTLYITIVIGIKYNQVLQLNCVRLDVRAKGQQGRAVVWLVWLVVMKNLLDGPVCHASGARAIARQND